MLVTLIHIPKIMIISLLLSRYNSYLLYTLQIDLIYQTANQPKFYFPTNLECECNVIFFCTAGYSYLWKIKSKWKTIQIPDVIYIVVDTSLARNWNMIRWNKYRWDDNWYDKQNKTRFSLRAPRRSSFRLAPKNIITKLRTLKIIRSNEIVQSMKVHYYLSTKSW